MTAFDAALMAYGTSEDPSRRSHRWIEQYLSEWKWLDQDDSKTAWCGIGMYAFHIEAGFPRNILPKEPYRAKEWMLFGEWVAIEERRLGDILILERVNSKGNIIGHHVCFHVNIDPRNHRRDNVLGANQSNMINIQPYWNFRIIAVRRWDYDSLV